MTYFVTYGTAMACYAYFVLTKQEYLFKEASDRQYLLNFYKRAQGRTRADDECCWELRAHAVVSSGIMRGQGSQRAFPDIGHGCP